jgi:hypothetical protein
MHSSAELEGEQRQLVTRYDIVTGRSWRVLLYAPNYTRFFA